MLAYRKIKKEHANRRVRIQNVTNENICTECSEKY